MNSTLILICSLCIVGALMLVSYYAHYIKPFITKRSYIKMELSRSSEREYDYWRQELKKNRLLLIPLFGKYLKRKII